MRNQTLRRSVGAGLAVLTAVSLAVLVPWNTDGPERIPSGFRAHWDPLPVQVHRRGAFDYVTSPPPDTFMVATTATRYVATTGNDANTGLVQGLPKRSLWSASLAAGGTATTIYVASGTYDASYGWVGVTPTGDQNVIATGGRVRLTPANLALSWSVDVAGTYTASVAGAPYTLGNPYAVIDESQLTTEGLGTWQTLGASEASVIATPGTWYVSTALHLVYVHLYDGRAPDAHVFVMPTQKSNGIINGAARKLYVRGVDFIGGSRAFFAQTADSLVFDDVSFRYAELEGLGIFLTNYVYSFGCYADENNADGFQYDGTSRILRALEVGCTGRRNGKGAEGATTGINNGSTSHVGTTILRVGGDYEHDDGPVVADVNDGWSLNFGVTVADSTAVTNTQRVGFYADGQMWLRECRVDPTNMTYDVLAQDAPDAVFANGSRYVTTHGSGTIGGWPQ